MTILDQRRHAIVAEAMDKLRATMPIPNEGDVLDILDELEMAGEAVKKAAERSGFKMSDILGR